jgi:hypothetical protein
MVSGKETETVPVKEAFLWKAQWKIRSLFAASGTS